MKNSYLKIAGVLNLLTAIVHLIAGQIDLVNPLIDSNMMIQAKGEFVAVWHMVTILLFFTSYHILVAAFKGLEIKDTSHLKLISDFYMLSGIPFLVASVWFSIFAPQWILLIPIGLLLRIGLRKLGE
ncbi:MAG: hypothetical protein AB8F74_01605 [Saprospiraceae bacterium]